MGAPTNHEDALKRAALWLGILIDHAEIEPDDTTVRAKITAGEKAGEVLVECNLGEDLKAFAALGARSYLLSEEAVA